MTQVSGQNEKFLRKEFVVGEVFKIMEPLLPFLEIFPKIKADARAVSYKQETVSASSDTKKKTPRTRSPSAAWTYLDITPMEMKSGILNKKGFAIRVDEDAIDFTDGVDEIRRAYNKVAFWLAQDQNTTVGDAIKAGATTPTWTPSAVWSDGAATPVDDLIRLEEQMEREGYPYRMTDIFINKTNWYELKGYLTSADIDGTKQKEIYGMPTITGDTIDIPVVGSGVHKLLSGVDEGYVLALDRNNPAATIYYNNSQRYSTQKISYPTVVDGRKTTKTVPNFGFNFNQYTDNETHDVVMQFWFDQVTVVKEPYAAQYDNGI